MRKIRLSGNGFEVSEDPGRALAGFLETALGPSNDHADLLRRLSPNGEGYAVPELSGALPVSNSPEDWPSELEFEGFEKLKEPWIVYEEVPGKPTRKIWIEGVELRRLFQEALKLRKA